ncbi:MAG: M23 family metallopeptidase [Kouleothrix sp.]|jgi:hypothetical protein|nr:M23 family metallopeptidase [Kouleothrix sp.]
MRSIGLALSGLVLAALLTFGRPGVVVLPSMPNGAWTVRIGSATFDVTLGPRVVRAQSARQTGFIGESERERWARDLLAALGNQQPTRETVGLVVAWQSAENTGAAFNPLATTQPADGATCWNSLPSMLCGVKSYTTYEQGLQATIETLSNGFYPNILTGLQSNNPEQALNVDELDVWGTGFELVKSQYGLLMSQPAPSVGKSEIVPGMEINAGFYDTGSVWCFQSAVCQHLGTDIAGADGQEVLAPFSGTCIETGSYPEGGSTAGQYVRYALADGSEVYLGHLREALNCMAGTSLLAGQAVGLIRADMLHTHFQIKDAAGTLIDPFEYWKKH